MSDGAARSPGASAIAGRSVEPARPRRLTRTRSVAALGLAGWMLGWRGLLGMLLAPVLPGRWTTAAAMAGASGRRPSSSWWGRGARRAGSRSSTWSGGADARPCRLTPRVVRTATPRAARGRTARSTGTRPGTPGGNPDSRSRSRPVGTRSRRGDGSGRVTSSCGGLSSTRFSAGASSGLPRHEPAWPISPGVVGQGPGRGLRDHAGATPAASQSPRSAVTGSAFAARHAGPPMAAVATTATRRAAAR
jgi:hypothetical protein